MRKTKRRNSLRVAILGAGPTALLVQRACRDVGLPFENVTTLSDKVGSIPTGSFYLHKLPETIENYFPARLVTWGTGTGEAYARNQYQFLDRGELPETSWPGSEPVVSPIWDFGEMVDEFRWGEVQVGYYFKRDSTVQHLGTKYDVVFQTFPSAASIQYQPEPITFPVVTFNWSKGNGSSEAFTYFRRFQNLVQISPVTIANWEHIAAVAANLPIKETVHYIIYNGSKHWRWVRFSYLWGKAHVEYPSGWHVSVKGNATGYLTVRSQRSLHPDSKPDLRQLAPNIYPIGRFATWDTKTLTHHSYFRACGILRNYITGE